MKFFTTAVAVGLALLQVTEAGSNPAVQRRDDALPAFRMPYPNTGKWKSHYDEDVKKYGYGGGPTMHYGDVPSGGHKDSCKSKSKSTGQYGGSNDQQQQGEKGEKDEKGEKGEKDGKDGKGEKDGKDGKGGKGGKGGHGGNGGPVVVHDNNSDDESVDTPAPATNNQTIACSAGAPFCCTADNGSGGGEFVFGAFLPLSFQLTVGENAR